MEGGDTYQAPYGSQEWENSFSQIMERTRKNISRISTRYSTGAVDPMPSMPPRGGSNLSVMPPPPPKMISSSGLRVQKENIQSGSSSTLLDSLVQRLSHLESVVEANSDGEARQIVDQRLRTLEANVDELNATLANVAGQLRDVHKLSSATSQQVARQGAVLESVQQELDLRRGTVARMDSWVKQGEVWREEVESQLSVMSKSIRAGVREANEQAEAMSRAATKSDLDSLKERLHILTQQAVAASVAAHSEKIEDSMKVLERQVAAVRAGRSVGTEPNAADMSPDEIADAFSAPQPSELMVRSMVGAEMRELESEVEEKLLSRVVAAMRGEVADHCSEQRKDMKDYITRVAAELGIVAEEGQKESIAARVIAAKHSTQKELSDMAARVEECRAALVNVQDAQQNGERGLRVEMRGLERRVDEGAATSAAAAQQVAQRAVSLEELVKEVESSQRKWHRELRDELYSKSKEHYDDWLEDRMALDKRVIVVEKIVDKFSEKLTTSRDVLESMLAGSPEMKTVYSTSSKVDSLSTEVQSMRAELRANASAVSGLKETSAGKGDVGEVKERLAHVESLSAQLKSIGSMQVSIGQADIALGILKTSVEDAEARIQKLSNVTHSNEKKLDGESVRTTRKLEDLADRITSIGREQALQAELMGAQVAAAAGQKQAEAYEATRVMVKDVSQAAANAAARSAVASVEQRSLSFQSAVDGRLSKLETLQDALKHAVRKAELSVEELASQQAINAQAASSIMFQAPPPPSHETVRFPPVPTAQPPPESESRLRVKNEPILGQEQEQARPSAEGDSPVVYPRLDGSSRRQSPFVVDVDTSAVIASATKSSPVRSSSVKDSPVSGDVQIANYFAEPDTSPSQGEKDDEDDNDEEEEEHDGGHIMTGSSTLPAPSQAVSPVMTGRSSKGEMTPRTEASSRDRSMSHHSSEFDEGFDNIMELPTVDRHETRAEPIETVEEVHSDDRDNSDYVSEDSTSGAAATPAAAVNNMSVLDESAISAVNTTFNTALGASPGALVDSGSNDDGVMAFSTPPESPQKVDSTTLSISRDTASSIGGGSPALSASPPRKIKSEGTSGTKGKKSTPPTSSSSPSRTKSALKSSEKEKKSKSTPSSSSPSRAPPIPPPPTSSGVSLSESLGTKASGKVSSRAPTPTKSPRGTSPGTKSVRTKSPAASPSTSGSSSKRPPMPAYVEPDAPPSSSLSPSTSASAMKSPVKSVTMAGAGDTASATPSASVGSDGSVGSATKGLSAKERIRMKLMSRKLEAKKK